jgi:hypothetical protein
MSRLKTSSYWKAVRECYAALGGKFVRQASGEQGAHTPTDKARWSIARELGYTGNRLCLHCNATLVAEPGTVVKHCGVLMAADITQSERNEIENSIGKLKVSFKAKDLLPGGDADNSDKDTFEKKELEEGKDHEKEHTDSDDVASEIASDHLKKDDDYYDKLKKKTSSAEITAHFIRDDEDIAESHWVVKKAGNPVLKVTLKQAFPGKEKTKAPIFAQSKYGEELISTVKARGVEGTVKTALKNGATVFGQYNQMNPNTLMPAPENVEDTEMQGKPPTDPQANPGMIDQEVGDEILDDDQQRTDIVELVKAALVPFIASAGDEITVQSVVAELKALCQNDQSLNDFQGSLDEQVEQFQQDNSVAEEDQKDADRGDVPEDPMADAGAGMPPPDQQPLQAQLSNKREAQLVEEAEALRTALKEHEEANSKLVGELKKAQSNSTEYQRRYSQQLEDNKVLLIERTMRARQPRCAVLAQGMVNIGEISEEEKGDKITALLKMPTDEFLTLESRVKKVHSKLVVRQASAPDINTKGLMPIIDDHRGEGNESTLADGPRKGANQKSAGLVTSVNWS